MDQNYYDDPKMTPTPDEKEELFGISNDELNKIFYAINEYINMIEIKGKGDDKILFEFSNVEDLVKNYLKELSMLSRSRRKDLKTMLYEILNEKFKEYKENSDIKLNVKKQYESIFGKSNEKQLQNEIITYFENARVNKDNKSNSGVLAHLYMNYKVKLLSNLMMEYNIKSFPTFLLKEYNFMIKQKTRRICKEKLDIDYYKYEIVSKIEYEVLKNFFEKICSSQLNIFDDKIIRKLEREILFKLLILTNLGYLKQSKFSKGVLLDNLNRYLLSFQLYEESGEDINKDLNEYVNFINISLELNQEDIDKLIKDFYLKLEKDLYAEKYLFILLSYSITLNNIFKLHYTHKKINLELNEFTCSSRERVFLMNIMRSLQNNLYNDNTKPYNSVKINFNIENFIFINLIKMNYSNLLDEDFSHKVDIKSDAIIKLIKNDTKKSILIKDDFDKFLKNLNVSTGLIDKVKTEFTEIFNNLLKLENNRNKVDLSSLNLISYDKKFFSNHIYIFVSGFTSQGENKEKAWEGFLLEYSNLVDCYFYDWESKSKSQMVWDIAKFIGEAALTYYMNKRDFVVLLQNLHRYRTNTNLFLKTRKTSKIFGELLAYIVASRAIFKHQNVSLVGFSLGCNVIKYCLKTLFRFYQNGELTANDIIKNVVFIAGAASFKHKHKWENIFELVAGKIVNCHGDFDNILKYLYTMSTNKDPIGVNPLIIKNLVNNVDFSDLKVDHSEYREEFRKIFSRLHLFE